MKKTFTVIRSFRFWNAKARGPFTDGKASEVGNVNFTFFTTEVMLGLLGPSLCMYYSSRAGQIQARQSVVKHYSPYLFTTTKTAYQQSSVCQLEFDLTAPEDALKIIYGEGGSCTNLTGESEFGNVENDEALEMAGVKLTKAGATTATFRSLRSSFLQLSKINDDEAESSKTMSIS